MADGGAERALSATFPPPPPFWKHFTTDNLNKLEQIKEEHSKQHTGSVRKKKWTPAELQSLNVPAELRYLIPPEIPKTGSYNVFGEPQSLSTTLPSLEEQGIEQLYPSSLAVDKDKPLSPSSSSQNASPPLNHAYYLLKISKSLLLNFLEFVGILSVEPEQFEDKLEDLRNLFINAHHLLNLYRPHQARESLILMMEEQLDRTREEIEEIDRTKERVENLLERLRTEGADANSASSTQQADSKNATDVEDGTLEQIRQVWALIDEDSD